MLANLAAEHGGSDCQENDSEVECNSKRSCHDMPCALQQKRKIGNGYGVYKISKVGMTPEQRKQRIQAGWIALVGEYRKEEKRCCQCIENACRRKLMRRVDCLIQTIAIHEDELIVISEQRSHGGPEESTNTQSVFLHELVECVHMYSEPAANHEDEHIVDDPVIQTIQEKWFEKWVFHAVDHEIEACAEAGKIVNGNLQKEKQAEVPPVCTADHIDPERHQQVEPDEDDQEVKLVLCVAEEQQARKRKQ